MQPRTICAVLLTCWLGQQSVTAVAQSTSAAGGQGRDATVEFDALPGLKLTAELRFPASASPKAIVVVMHGGGGIGELEQRDVRELLAKGYAAVLVDSFTGRGFRVASGTGAGAAVRPADRAADAFGALKALAPDASLAGKRWILFGRSHGGSATMVAATAWAKTKYGSGGVPFSGFIALYPGCNASYPEQEQSSAPIRIHVGADDDLTPAKPCIAAVERMKSKGVDASVVVYANAHHAFDLESDVQFHPQWFSVGKCDIKLPSLSSPLPMDEIARCGRRGASMGSNVKAAADFRSNLFREIEQFSQ